MRRFISILMIIMTCIGVIPAFSMKANADNNVIESSDFLEIYKANLAFEKGNNPVNNGVSPYIDSVLYEHEIGHPSKILMNDLNVSSKFKNNLVQYKFWTADPSKFVEIVEEEREFYTAVLLALLNISTTNDAKIEAYNSKWVTTSMDAGVWIIDGMKENFNIAIDVNTKISDLDGTVKEKLKTMFQMTLKDKYDLGEGAVKGIEIFDTYIDILETVQDMVNIISSYICIYNMETETFAVLREMKTFATDPQMIYALDKIINCEEDIVATIYNGIIDGGTTVFTTIYEKVVDTMWTDIALSSPFAIYYISQKGTDLLCNLCWSTEEISEQYYKMDVLCKTEEILYKAINSLGEKYISNKTLQNAKTYNESVDLYFNLYNESCDYAKSFANIVFKKNIAGLLGEKDGYEDFILDVNKMQMYAKQDYASLQNNYIFYLEEDYPEIYNKMENHKSNVYINQDEEKYIAVEEIAFFNTEVILEYPNDIFVVCANVYPSNASNKNVIYKSSDESILLVPEKGGFATLKGAGIVTITASTEDGKHIAQQKVFIRKSEEEIPRPKVGEVFTVNNLTYKIVKNNEVEIYKGVPDINGHIEIPEKVFYAGYNYPVIGIAEGKYNGSASQGAFTNGAAYMRYNTKLKSITIPDSITYIGSLAFIYCAGMEEIVIPCSVKKFGFDVFSWTGNVVIVCHEDSAAASYVTETGEFAGSGGGTYHNGNKYYSVKRKIIPHTYNKIQGEIEDTCIREVNYMCSECGMKKTEIIVEHDYSSNWTIDKKATTTANGSKSKHCTRCSAKTSVTTIYKASSVKLSTATYVYNGKMRNPSVIVKNSKGNVIGSTNYTITKPSGRKNVGKYTYKITFKNQYSGTKSLTLTINPKGTTISSITNASKAFTVKWKKQSEKMTTTRITGYQIQYSTSKQFTNPKSKTVTGYGVTSKKITGLKAKTTYYVRVRTYKTVKVNGKSVKLYSGWSTVKSVKTK